MNGIDEKIKRHLPEEELLLQLAEECAELAQAALKLRRVLAGINPTPITEDEARENLLEETADIYCVLGVLLDSIKQLEVYDITERKRARWAARLDEQEARV